MKTQIAKALNSINVEFYNQCAASFSATRHGSWAGWEKALDHAGAATPPSSVIDLACGNMRFEAFLSETFPAAPINAHCIDVCCDLAALSRASGDRIEIDFTQADIVSAVIDGSLEKELLGIAPSDLCVCMGFMHHIPGYDRRCAVLKWLAGHAQPRGSVIVAFWQFMESPRLASQARRLTPLTCIERGIPADELEGGDHFLGWQNSETLRRYCHSFTATEVSRLAAEAFPQPDFKVSFFEADGKEGNLNRYLVATRR